MATTTIFDSPTALGLKPIIIETTVTNVSGAYTATINDERITVAMRPIDIEIEHPDIFNANISVTCNNGSVTISCADVSGTSGVVISILKVTEEDPMTVTSAEFDILNNRKVDKDQGVANAGKALGINAQGIVEPVPFSGEDFTGATSSAAGTHGYVPAPSAGDQGKFLKGSGAWATVPFPPTMGGATSSDSGVSGLVPTPVAGDQEKVLTGAGTWVTPVGSRVLIIDLDDVTNTSGSYTHTTTVTGMTGDLKAVAIECSDPTIFKARVSVITATDSVTLICDEVAGTSTVKVSFLAIGNANPLSSTEYGALDARIGSLSNLTTTDKSSVVNAVNEVNNKIVQVTPSTGVTLNSAQVHMIGKMVTGIFAITSTTGGWAANQWYTNVASIAVHPTVATINPCVTGGGNSGLLRINTDGTVDVYITSATSSIYSVISFDTN